MSKIRLPNRDGANLWLEPSENNIWKLKVDDSHAWVLEYMRVIGDYPNHIIAVDPSGGPYIEVEDTLKDTKNNRYKIVKIINCTTFEIVKWEQ